MTPGAAAIGADLANAQTAEAAAASLRELASSAFAPERILRVTFCAGVEALAEHASTEPDATISAEDWRSFLVQAGTNWAFEIVGEVVAEVEIAGAVDAFMTGIELAEIHAGAAQLYLRACALA